MAWAYHIYRIDPGNDIIAVEHIFYGRSKAECLVEYHAHLEACTGLNAAECEDRIEEEWEELTEEELPRPNEEEEGDR